MKRVLVVGDLMLDEYVYGDCSRISPEAATPILSVTRKVTMAGGAGNVARGIAALDCNLDIVGVVGVDKAGFALVDSLKESERCEFWIVTDDTRPTTHKIRYVSEQHSSHLLRVDRESNEPISEDTESRLLQCALVALNECNVVVLSDYCKGVMTLRLVCELMHHARQQNKPVIVDSKRTDLRIFHNASIVKLNRMELGFTDQPSMELIGDHAHSLCQMHRFDHVVVTLGEEGMVRFSRQSAPLYIPGRPVRVRDVSGAGDTVVAVLATGLAEGSTLDDALRLANVAASMAVAKPGTAVVTKAELASGKVDMLPGEWSLLKQRLIEWRGQKIGLANGCFDLLHMGHIDFLSRARGYCDHLIVALNDDASVQRLKGEGRPLQTANERAVVLAALDTVDLVAVFTGDDPSDLCELIRPDCMFKGDEYESHNVAGREFAKVLYLLERVPDQSTTQIIERIKAK